MQETELIKLLQSHNIPLDEWGSGEAKTLKHLLSEIQSGEAVLIETEGGLLRCAQGAGVIVYHIEPGRQWRLREDRQVFRDGRTKRRNLETSVGEKSRKGEPAIEAAYRALAEELEIQERLPLIPRDPLIKGPVPSQSFPGLMTRYVMSVYEVFLPKHLYKSEGYVEHQEDKDNYFVWV